MDNFLNVRVFDWGGRWHVVVERVEPVAGRRHARRTRLFSRTWEPGVVMDEAGAVALLQQALTGVSDRLH